MDQLLGSQQCVLGDTLGFGRKQLLAVRRRALTGTLADPLFGLGLWVLTLRASPLRSRAHSLPACVRTGEDGVEVALQPTTDHLRSPSLIRAYENPDATLGADTRRGPRSSARASSHATPRGLRSGARARATLWALLGARLSQNHPLSHRSHAHFPVARDESSVLTVYLDWGPLPCSPLQTQAVWLTPTDSLPRLTTFH